MLHVIETNNVQSSNETNHERIKDQNCSIEKLVSADQLIVSCWFHFKKKTTK